MNRKWIILPVVFCALSAMGPAAARAQAVADKDITEKECRVAVDVLNVRTGPGLWYPVTGVVKKDETLEVLSVMGQWYVVVLPDGSVGVISGEHVNISKTAASTAAPMPTAAEGDSETEVVSEPDSDERDRLFAMVNNIRIENRLTPFIWDSRLNNVAQIKAEDMAANNYFSHYSPNYGTPFAMLKQMGILYKTASQNIASNKSVEDAHQKMMESMAHSANILSLRYNKMGVGVVESNGTYIIVQMFIEE